MEQVMNDLGARVLNAARLAVAMHLSQSTPNENAHRQVVIGGAGPRFVTDGMPGAPVDRAARDMSRAARKPVE
ncbi:MAG TPA: hypothetical protein VGN72_09875 [Tepidisphaeraceae bacterium]|jgi:hypothetical protein|nr:hypothetical protein [Tepidisphaeraceae bacterium]